MALPDPRKRLAQQRAKEKREAMRAKKSEEAHVVRYKPPLPHLDILKVKIPFCYKGCNIFTISKQEVLISNSDKTFLKIERTDSGFDIYKLGVLIYSSSKDYFQIDANIIRSIVDYAFSVA